MGRGAIVGQGVGLLKKHVAGGEKKQKRENGKEGQNNEMKGDLFEYIWYNTRCRM